LNLREDLFSQENKIKIEGMSKQSAGKGKKNTKSQNAPSK
jgi:hypothetical protein